uniref:uncharacterized protein LOC120348618 n=1 Tax=Styela clava TaxID=7725 RepID=UPI00193A98E4|nr:uncharacterized protein LOC120348618 [Styela clava]
MATSHIKPSPSKPVGSPNIAVITVDSPTRNSNGLPTISSSINTLYPGLSQDRRESDADRYFTASSGDERFDDEDDDSNDEDDDDGMCIMLDSDDEDADAGSLSGLHINLKTLQAVSNMLAHYTPIIQRDMNGNPVFVAPPPPIGDVSANATPTKHTASEKSPLRTILSSSGGDDVTEEFQIALQELENVVISAEEDTLFVDKMSELTEVMEKMTYFAAEEVDDI